MVISQPALFHFAVLLRMVFCGFLRIVGRIQRMPMRDVAVTPCRFVMTLYRDTSRLFCNPSDTAAVRGHVGEDRNAAVAGGIK